MTTIKMNRIANITAIGHHNHKNNKPVVRLAPFAIYASASDAGEKNNVTVSAISLVCSGKSKSCKGLHYCWLSDLYEHLDEITENFNVQSAKAEAYDELLAKQKAEEEARQQAKKEAEEKYALHKQKCDELRAELEKEEQLLLEAEQLYKELSK